MKLILENWRKYLKEETEASASDVDELASLLVEEGVEKLVAGGIATAFATYPKLIGEFIWFIKNAPRRLKAKFFEGVGFIILSKAPQRAAVLYLGATLGVAVFWAFLLEQGAEVLIPILIDKLLPGKFKTDALKRLREAEELLRKGELSLDKDAWNSLAADFLIAYRFNPHVFDHFKELHQAVTKNSSLSGAFWKILIRGFIPSERFGD